MIEQQPRKDVLGADTIEIVQLSPDDWEKLRDLKLQSLSEEPVAFENPDEAITKYQDRSEQEWRTILSGGMSGGKSGETIMYFAKDGDECIGMVSLIIPEIEADQEKVATVQHMYVTSSNRSRGVGKKLITTLVSRLRSRRDISKAELDVVVTQTPAISLYHSFGFSVVGTSKGSIDWTEEPIDELNMELTF